MKIAEIKENLKKEALDISEDMLDVLVNDKQWMNELVIKAQNHGLEKAFDEIQQMSNELERSKND